MIANLSEAKNVICARNYGPPCIVCMLLNLLYFVTQLALEQTCNLVKAHCAKKNTGSPQKNRTCHGWSDICPAYGTVRINLCPAYGTVGINLCPAYGTVSINLTQQPVIYRVASMLQPWQTRFSCGDPDYFWHSVITEDSRKKERRQK